MARLPVVFGAVLVMGTALVATGVGSSASGQAAQRVVAQHRIGTSVDQRGIYA